MKSISNGDAWLFVLFTNGSRFRFNHSERSRVIYLSFDPVAHAREMYVSIGSFPFSRFSCFPKVDPKLSAARRK